MIFREHYVLSVNIQLVCETDIITDQFCSLCRPVRPSQDPNVLFTEYIYLILPIEILDLDNSL